MEILSIKKFNKNLIFVNLANIITNTDQIYYSLLLLYDERIAAITQEGRKVKTVIDKSLEKLEKEIIIENN